MVVATSPLEDDEEEADSRPKSGIDIEVDTQAGIGAIGGTTETTGVMIGPAVEKWPGEVMGDGARILSPHICIGPMFVLPRFSINLEIVS